MTRTETDQPVFEVTLSGALPQPLEREELIQLTRAVTVRCGYVCDQEIVAFQKGDVFPARSELASVLRADAFERTEILRLNQVSAHPGAGGVFYSADPPGTALSPRISPRLVGGRE